MTGLSSHSVRCVQLTLIALFLLMMSSWASWYVVSVRSFAVGEYWMDRLNPISSGGIVTYHGYDEASQVMAMVHLCMILWFILAIVFLGCILEEDPIPDKKFVIGGAIIAVGLFMLGCFALAFPPACPADYVSGFFSRTTIDGTVYTGRPGVGYVLAAIAWVVQTVAVVLRRRAEFTVPPLSEKPEPFEAPVIKTPPE